jgi:hypothetical protein
MSFVYEIIGLIWVKEGAKIEGKEHIEKGENEES